MNTYFIHAHGRVCSLDEDASVFAVPDNCFIISLCDNTEFLDDDHVTRSIFEFMKKKSCLLYLLKYYENFTEEGIHDDLKSLFTDFLNSLLDELNQNPNQFCIYPPKYLFNNMSLLFCDKNNKFPAGLYPSFPKEISRQPDIVKYVSDNNSHLSIHNKFVNSNKRAKLQDIINGLCDNHYDQTDPTYQDGLKRINLFFIFACKTISTKKTVQDVLDCTNKIPLVEDNFNKVVKDMLVQYYILNPSKIGEMKDDIKTFLGFDGGGHYYFVKNEKQTNRRYILLKRKKWFLDENKNRYRYDTRFKNKSVIILRSNVN
jgi:hypothetical protein